MFNLGGSEVYKSSCIQYTTVRNERAQIRAQLLFSPCTDTRVARTTSWFSTTPREDVRKHSIPGAICCGYCIHSRVRSGFSLPFDEGDAGLLDGAADERPRGDASVRFSFAISVDVSGGAYINSDSRPALR